MKDAELQRQKTQEAEERLMEKNRVLLQVQVLLSKIAFTFSFNLLKF